MGGMGMGGGPGGFFSLHTVNTSDHTAGHYDLKYWEGVFLENWDSMLKTGDMNAFMDYNTAFWTKDLDQYIKKFEADKIDYFPVSYYSGNGIYWSILVNVAGTQVNLELTSNSPGKVLKSHEWSHTNEQRITFTKALSDMAFDTPKEYLFPLKISRGSHRIDHDVEFMKDIMGAKQTSRQKVNGVTTVSFDYTTTSSKAAVQIQLVERPGATTKTQDIKSYYEYMMSVHKKVMTSAVCGFDKWLDNHYAFDQQTKSLDTFVAKFKKHNVLYHVWKMGGGGAMGGRGRGRRGLQPGGGSRCNIYMVDSTGWAVQLDGTFKNCPSDAASFPVDYCGQGTCSADGN